MDIVLRYVPESYRAQCSLRTTPPQPSANLLLCVTQSCLINSVSELKCFDRSVTRGLYTVPRTAIF